MNHAVYLIDSAGLLVHPDSGREPRGASGLLDAARAAGIRAAPLDDAAAALDPDELIAAARRFGAKPADCVLFSARALSLEAARQVGMRRVGIGAAPGLAEAELVQASLESCSVEGVERALAALEEFRGREAWLIVERDLTSGNSGAHETRFALANGSLCLRGRSPFAAAAQPGCFVAGAFDASGSSVVELATLPDPTVLGLFVDYEPVELTSGRTDDYRRTLDMERGLSVSACAFTARTGASLRSRCERFVSGVDEEFWAERWTVRADNFSRRVLLLQAIDGSLRNAETHPIDVVKHFSVERCVDLGYGLALVARLNDSGDRIVYVNAVLSAPGAESGPSRVRFASGAERVEETLALEVREGAALSFDRMGLVRRLGAGVSAEDAIARAEASLKAHRDRGYVGARDAHAAAWRRRWDAADVRIEGDLDACRALRFNLFHLMQALPGRDEGVSIGAKGLHGEGYKGHVFWDTETFMLPFFLHTDPEAARRLLSYRFRTLGGARRNASGGGHHGARFAWESASDGSETTPRWGVDYAGKSVRIWTGDLEVHIGADIAYAVESYERATGDQGFMRERGLELLCSIAEFWASYFKPEGSDGRLHARDVVGTDEFHEHVGDDAFTNHMAAWTLRKAAEAAEAERSRDPEGFARSLVAWGVAEAPERRWQSVADRIVDPFSAARDGIVEQFDGYFDLPDYPIEAWDENGLPLWPAGLDLSRLGETRLIKQPDVVQVFALLFEEFERDFMLRNYDFYEARTMHKSSLSPSIHAMVGVRLGETSRAYEYFLKTVHADLADNQGNTALGFHAASAGGAWQAAVFGFGGFSVRRDGRDGWVPSFDPWLPPAWQALEYSIAWRGERLRVRVEGRTIRLSASAPLHAYVRGARVRVDTEGYREELG